ncbi:MAG: glycosyltransferase [Candidatus Marinimicrobia bacterium]|nr:glycosyltransferase [Candidatus Neomarinimicrobiota bacterium]MBT3634436.1 glycosyltransferase [Candidatus Neomarinimicrobiota bacterium]MBT3683263.1 glycosyltransferase [Candidatus Neomarinimicrobiota bacterium]MBT3760151.1 glycosyltransferase [Candidatus Neomarinimicrobiota bacterium]MBT3896246.1 glycosyltransferase [Candidatus Neomarinimicrobiota bacterium]
MTLSIIIVSYNVSDYLRQCLSAIYDSTIIDQTEIIVIDNDSFDNSVNMISKEFPEVKLKVNIENSGFSHAVNQGVAMSTGNLICLLNPDSIIKSDTLEILSEYLLSNPDTGVVGCKVLNPDGSFQLASRRRFPRPSVAIPRMLGLQKLFPNVKMFAKYNQTDQDDSTIQETDAVSGSCMMFKKEVFDDVGEFDERFFLYFEDTDFCYRVKSKGYKVKYIPDTQIIHYKGESMKHAPYNTLTQFHHSAYQFFEKYSHEFKFWFILRIFLKAAIQLRKLTTYIKHFRSSIISSAYDAGLIILSYIFGMVLWYPYHHGIPITLSYIVDHWQLLFTYLAIWFATAIWLQLYKKNNLSYGRALVTSTITFVLVTSITYFLSIFAYSRALLIITFFCSAFFISLWRIIVHIRYRQRRIKSFEFPPLFTRKAIILGNFDSAKNISNLLNRNPSLYYQIHGYIDESFCGNADDKLPYLGRLHELSDIVKNSQINELIILEESYPVSAIIEQIQNLSSSNVVFKFVPDGQHYLIGKGVIEDIGGVPLVDIDFPLFDHIHLFTKRIFDFSLASILILATMPIQVFYFISGKFKVIKVWNTNQSPIKLTELDSNSGFIRNLPYLYKIIAGEISFVGSRVINYTEPDPKSMIKPGITGLHQLKKDTGMNSISEFEQYYIQNHNLVFDLEILLKSILRI